MAIYYGLLILVTGLGLWLGRDDRRSWPRAVYCGAITLICILIAGLRYGIGFDYWNYERQFASIQQTAWLSPWDFSSEIGFVELTKLFQLISANTNVLYTLYAALMVGIVGYVIWRRSEMPWLSFFLFITLQYLASAMNYLRQTLAGFLFLLAIPYLQKRRLLPYLLIVLLAASVHKSALILIPVYFVAHLPLNRYTGALYAGGTLAAFLFSDYILDLVMRVAYGHYAQEEIYYAGSSFIYVMILVVLCAFVIVFKDRLCRGRPENIVYVNLMVYACFFSLLMVRHFIVERFSLYFLPSIILSLPMLLRTFRPEMQYAPANDGKFRSERAQKAALRRQQKEQKQIYVAIVTSICLLCFTHFLISVSYKFHNVYPYYSVFSEEAKNGEKIPYIPYWKEAEEKTGMKIGAEG